ncbi:MAG: twin-arginine translocation signal domain-containing protein [Gammaproteobacteria bacterium]|nr:twin-arginine translocation signal domain-containing protein [Gammaproteobacteria bacterium]MDH5653567.1 twin-arginine translocation signal domain-containing protein [Gammaproteobacteria bacterium]
MAADFNPSRRRFLKTGLAGAAVLGFAGWWASRDEACTDCQWLQQGERDLLLAVIPVMLAGALPVDATQRKQAIQEVMTGFDTTLTYFPPVVRGEIRQLLWLLKSPLTRGALTGVWSSWSTAESNTIHDFLNRWQTSRFDLLRAGYSALHDLIIGVWYANPLSWQRIAYPGPPKL